MSNGFRCWASIALCLGACSSEARVGNRADAGGDTGSVFAPGTYGEFVTQFFDAYCGVVSRCCVQDSALSAEQCSGEAQVPQEAAHESLSPSMRQGAQACLEQIREQSCGATRTRVADPLMIPLSEGAETACTALLPRVTPVCHTGQSCDGPCVDDVCLPRRQTGQACCFEAGGGSYTCANRYCQLDDYCQLVSTSPIEGLCEPRKAIGAECSSDEECASARCGGSSGRCEAWSFERDSECSTARRGDG